MSQAAPTPINPNSGLVVRQQVPALTEYGAYKRYLRYDFFYSCAYCTISESEAQTIRFTIDHYEPVSISPTLKCEYSNLLYVCDSCNMLKGDLWPPAEAQAAGKKFFRPDFNIFSEHFKLKHTLKGIEIEGITPVGEFTVEQIDLNRQVLRRIRTLRAELRECEKFVAHGVYQLRNFHIDQLPTQIKAKAQRLITEVIDIVDQSGDRIDDLLRSYARSHLADADPDAEERADARRESRKELKGLFPGLWRSPKVAKPLKKRTS